MKVSLTYKLLAGFMAVVIAVLAVVGVSGSVLIRNYLIADKEAELTAKAYELAKVVNSYHDKEITPRQLQRFINSVDNFLDARVWVVDEKLNLVNISGISPEPRPRHRRRHGGMMHNNRFNQNNKEPPADMRRLRMPQQRDNPFNENLTLDLGQDSEKPISLSDVQNMEELNQIITANHSHPWTKTYYHPYYEENMIIAAIPLIRTNGAQTGTIMLNAPLAKIDGFLNDIYYYLFLAGLAGIIFAALLASYLANGIIRPLKTMRVAASAMARGEYGTRVDVSSSDEVGDLGRSLNSLAEDLKHYVSQMEKTDVMRKEFVANVSHELRTPLTILRGYNQALADGTISAPQEVEKTLSVMGDEITRLEKLIKELLDLSLLEADGTILELEEVDLKEIVENVLSLLKNRAAEYNVLFKTNLAENIPTLIADGARLTQLVLIFIDNALKFTPGGQEVTITLEQENKGVLLTISDTGNGIDPEDLPHIWERFYKKNNANPKQSTGLGLAIAKQILELHRSQVTVFSKPEAGTTFKIFFPNN